MAAFSLWLNPAMDVNRHFLENEYGGPILSVVQETIVENVNLASNRDYNHGATIRIYME